MPPSKSGIADYSAALVEPLSELAQVKVFSEKPPLFDPSSYDMTLYQIGNNGYHSFVYDQSNTMSPVTEPPAAPLCDSGARAPLGDFAAQWLEIVDLITTTRDPGRIRSGRT